MKRAYWEVIDFKGTSHLLSCQGPHLFQSFDEQKALGFVIKNYFETANDGIRSLKFEGLR